MQNQEAKILPSVQEGPYTWQACQNKEVQSYDIEETHVNVGNHNQF